VADVLDQKLTHERARHYIPPMSSIVTTNCHDELAKPPGGGCK
jgi:hypothetical protein